MSLREICQKRLLEDMIGESTKFGERYVVLVVSDKCLKVLSSLCRVYDILEKGVTVVELLNRRRQPLRDLDVIYFIDPEIGCVEAIVADFPSAAAGVYKNVYLYFSSALSDELMKVLVSHDNLLKRLKAVKEFNLNFLTYESRIFHLDNPNNIFNLYPLQQPDLLMDHVSKLSCLLATLNEGAPQIRSSPHPTPNRLASILSAKLKNYTKSNSTLLLLDRSIDLATLFIHEYTYQACAMDLLNIETVGELGRQYSFEVMSNAGKEEKKVAVLDETDALWTRFRHVHIDTVSKEVNSEVQQFLKENAAARLQRSQAPLSSAQTLQAIRALPQYQEMLAKYWTHVTITSECLEALKKDRLVSDLGTLEQDLASGVDVRGSDVSVSKALSTLGWILSDGEIGVDAKMRLLLLYLTQVVGGQEKERKKLVDASHLSLESQRAILTFLNMQLHTASEGKSKRLLEVTDPQRIKYNKKKAKSAEIGLSRFEPALKSILVQACQGNLPVSKFPYVQEPGTRKPVPQPESARGSGLAKSAKWDWSSSMDVAEPNIAEEGGARLIVFILGGVTLAETRCAYEVAREYKTDIILGGDTIISPHTFITQLKEHAEASMPF